MTRSSDSGSSTAEEGEPFESLKERAIKARIQASDRNTILAAILGRQIITPLVLVPLLYFVLRALASSPLGRNHIADVHEDPCFVLVSVLLIGAPPAITLAQMTCANPFPARTPAHARQETLNNRFQRLISRTLLVSYVCITPLTTILLVVAGVLLIQATK